MTKTSDILVPSVRDPCGDGLECRRTVGPIKICQCKFEEILCGSDGKTYSNLCQLMAAAVREQVTDTLIVKSVGPCDPGQSSCLAQTCILTVICILTCHKVRDCCTQAL